jgi:hypothetical protein
MTSVSSSWANLLCTFISIKLNLLIMGQEWMAFRNHSFMPSGAYLGRLERGILSIRTAFVCKANT